MSDLDQLRSPSEWTRLHAVMTLGKNKDATPALIESMTDPSESVRTMAALALGDLGDEAAIPAMAEATHDECSRVAKAAAIALGKIQKAA